MPSNPASAQTLVELKTQLTAAQAKHTAAIEAKADKVEVSRLQSQVDAIDVKLAGRLLSDFSLQGTTPLLEQLQADEGVAKLLKDKRGSAVIHLDGKTAQQLMQRKTTMTETGMGFQTTGVMQIDRTPGIVPEARQVLVMRDVLTARPTSLPVVDFVYVSTPMTIASPVPEASVKPEEALVFASKSEKIRTVAAWIPASRQILDDITELYGFIETAIPFYVNTAEELQILAGDNVGEDYHGIIPQASPFAVGSLSATHGWNRIDIVGLCISQITTAKEIQPTFIVLHPADWWAMRLTKDSFGRYILGDPQSQVRPNVFGLDVVATTNIGQGTFLVGSGNPVAVELRDKMEMVVEISTSHASYFTQNLIAIRGERRSCIVVKRPASFIQGSFSQSPA
jgi:HK97 family phage major capsid protein